MKKIRKLKINDTQYFWSVREYAYEGKVIKIWRENKTNLIFKGAPSYADKEITPSMVREIVLKEEGY